MNDQQLHFLLEALKNDEPPQKLMEVLERIADSVENIERLALEST